MERMWWNQVTNAVQFLNKITDSLLDEKSIILSYSQNMPWYHTMMGIVKETVQQKNSERRFEKIETDMEPGEYLLRNYCKAEKRALFRPSKGYPKFLAESDDIVLHDRYLWIIVDSYESLEKWQQFVSDYLKERGKNKNVAAFVLEWAGEGQITGKKGIKNISFEDYIGEYDRIVFAMLASSGISGKPFIKTYLAELVATVVENDMELCAECMKLHKTFLENPYILIQKLLQQKCRSDATPYLFDKTPEEVEHCIWLAQIKTIYPKLEEYREEFVQKHYDAIAERLPISASYGEVYTEPKDVELGTLCYMAGHGGLGLSTQSYDKLKAYKEARNKLSHLNTLGMEEIYRMFG